MLGNGVIDETEGIFAGFDKSDSHAWFYHLVSRQVHIGPRDFSPQLHGRTVGEMNGDLELFTYG